jgi:thiamine-monophosphate kinase
VAERSGEDALIARYFAPLAGEGGLNLADDAALLTPAPGHDLVLTVDALVAGIHFFPDDPPASIAAKALGVNLSDLAAKGAEPVGFLLALALPKDWTEPWLASFAGGLGEAAQRHGCPLLGGDTVRAAGALTLSITAFGQVPAGGMVRRAAARPGDRLCVTGTIGDAALGLAMRLTPDAPWAASLASEQREHLLDRYLHPRPRLCVAVALRRHARAAMDVSDGLVGDLAKMMRAGRTSATVDLDAMPFSQAAAAIVVDPALFERAVTGGDDYELLCAVPEGALDTFRAECAAAGVPVTVIGTVTSGTEEPLFTRGGAPVRFAQGSYGHFGDEA